MLCSLLEHNSVSRIHLFHDSIAGYELAKLKSLVEKYRSEITFYEVEPAAFQDLRVDKWVSAATYYRILGPRLLPTSISKVLYLDSDIIVRGSLTRLWSTDLADYALAAVSDCNDNARKALGLAEGTKYFNAGVLLINLRFWRQKNVAERAISFAKENPEKIQYWDQDALNATLAHQWVEIPQCWNWQYWRRTIPGTEMEPAIVHFLTENKPWHWSNDHPFKREYRRYRLKTPWRRYREEDQPRLPQRLRRSLKRFARLAVPRSARRWLRSRFKGSQA
jgi:lipopolysaccharide biosynthesis glycosyltransferase